MDVTTTIILTILMFVIALLYSSVGMGGGTSYVAAMAFLSIAPAIMKPSSLILNIIVASIASITYIRAGRFSWSILWPFLITSIPCAFLGGFITLQATVFKLIVGVVLLFASYQLVFASQGGGQQVLRPPRLSISLLVGALLGLVAGLTGTGGGFLLSPLFILMGWAEAQVVCGIIAVFVLVNSIFGLTGCLSKIAFVPKEIIFLAIAVTLGGCLGSRYGSQRASNKIIRKVLAVVLGIAALKMIFG
ncbi:MAG: sulfite exporter TauE/SafE family protein [Candidatus Desantisbacteria bacterium]